MPKILFSKPSAFGINISDFSIKMAQLSGQVGSFNMIAYGKKDLPVGIVEAGEIIKEDNLVSILKEIKRKTYGDILRNRYVVASLPEEKSFTRVIRLPKMKDKELDEAVKWEAEAHIPFQVSEVYIDWQPVDNFKADEKEDHFDILLAACPKRVVDSYVSVIKKAGLKLLTLELESQSIARSIIKDEKTESPVMVIDVGDRKTTIIIYAERSLRFTASVPISGFHFTEAVKRELNVSLKEAKDFKEKIGLDRKKKEGVVFEALISVLEDLVREIRRYVVFYEDHPNHELAPRDQKISRIFLCGGGANLVGLPSYLSLNLGIPVMRGNPWVNILKPPLKGLPELSYKESIAFASVLGLAIRGVRESEKFLSL